jgi:hypothetical protein|tara:strand:- start:1004 stop:1474 length:471 start_codon:yes stop_codon:yes gene_type:complete
MTDENIVKCISINENGEVLNITRGLDQTRNSICVDMTDKLKNIRKGDFLKGDIVLRDTEMGKKYGLRTIIDPEWVKKPLTPAELKHKWQMEKRELETEIRELQFQLMFCQSRYQMAVMLGDNVKKDKELAEYKRLETEHTALETKLAELIANEPQG